jgi:hypothetical protein
MASYSNKLAVLLLLGLCASAMAGERAKRSCSSMAAARVGHAATGRMSGRKQRCSSNSTQLWSTKQRSGLETRVQAV